LLSAFNQRTFVDVLKINLLHICSAPDPKALGSLSKIKPIVFLHSTELKAIGLLSKIYPIISLLSVLLKRTLVKV